MKRKKTFTILEIMVVICLIAIIGSVVGYNMKGSLDEGKAFKTKQAKLKLQDIFDMEIAKGASGESIAKNPTPYVMASGLVKKPDQILKDGWGENFQIAYADEQFTIISQRLIQHKFKKKGLFNPNEK